MLMAFSKSACQLHSPPAAAPPPVPRYSPVQPAAACSSTSLKANWSCSQPPSLSHLSLACAVLCCAVAPCSALCVREELRRGKMLRGGTSVLGIINFITFLISIPILGGGIWLASRANSTDCIRFLQWPIIVVGLVLMVISLMGFAGACYRQTWLLRLYLFAMFFVVLALLFFIVFAFAVTDRGDGQVVMNRRFPEYQLSDYSGWLRDRVADPQYWATISACLRDGHACAGMRRLARDPNTGMLVPETPAMFYGRNLSPIQSGCCKPPTSCAFTYMNETYWTQNPGVPTVMNDPDCSRWSNDQQMLCFQCDSCKAGVLAGIKKSWRKVAILNIVVLIILVIVYVAGCAAFRNARRIENDEPVGMARMTKSHPSRFQF